jgi:sensor c-di-GMP phosphodiesterase-like protein
MYEAKGTGRNRAVMFDASMRDEFINPLKFYEYMRGAVERCEFHLLYQPIVSLESGCVNPLGTCKSVR